MVSPKFTSKPATLPSARQSQAGHDHLSLSLVENWFNSLKVGQKISWGYGIALGAAMLGTIVAFSIADYQHRIALEQEEDALEELHLLSRLHVNVLEAHLHQRQLVFLMGKPQLWQAEYARYRQRAAVVRKLAAEFKGKYQYVPGSAQDSPEELEATDHLLDAYAQLDAALRPIEQRLQQIDSNPLPAAAVATVQRQLMDATSGALLFQFDVFSEQLDVLAEVA